MHVNLYEMDNKVDKIDGDGINKLPEETIINIFGRLNAKSIAYCSLVNKRWERMAKVHLQLPLIKSLSTANLFLDDIWMGSALDTIISLPLRPQFVAGRILVLSDTNEEYGQAISRIGTRVPMVVGTTVALMEESMKDDIAMGRMATVGNLPQLKVDTIALFKRGKKTPEHFHQSGVLTKFLDDVCVFSISPALIIMYMDSIFYFSFNIEDHFAELAAKIRELFGDVCFICHSSANLKCQSVLSYPNKRNKRYQIGAALVFTNKEGFAPQIEVNEDTTVEHKQGHAYLLKDGEMVRVVIKMGEREQVMIVGKAKGMLGVVEDEINDDGEDLFV